MKKIVYDCDICFKEISRYEIFSPFAGTTHYPTIFVPSKKLVWEGDLCPDCQKVVEVRANDLTEQLRYEFCETKSGYPQEEKDD